MRSESTSQLEKIKRLFIIRAVFLPLSIIAFSIFAYIFYFSYQTLGVNLFDFFYAIILVTLFKWSYWIIFPLTLLTIFFFTVWNRYDHYSTAVLLATAIFLYGGFILAIAGLVIFGYSTSETSTITINSSTTTNINFIYLNNTDPLNFTKIASFSYVNLNVSEHRNATPSSPQNDAIRKLTGGSFGNAVGLLGISLALFGFAQSNFDKFKEHEREESHLTYEQIETIGHLWIGVALIYYGIMSFFFNSLILQSYIIDAASCIFTCLFIQIIGWVIWLYSLHMNKRNHQYPINSESRKESFEEIVLRVHHDLTKEK